MSVQSFTIEVSNGSRLHHLVGEDFRILWMSPSDKLEGGEGSVVDPWSCKGNGH